MALQKAFLHVQRCVSSRPAHYTAWLWCGAPKESDSARRLLAFITDNHHHVSTQPSPEQDDLACRLPTFIAKHHHPHHRRSLTSPSACNLGQINGYGAGGRWPSTQLPGTGFCADGCLNQWQVAHFSSSTTKAAGMVPSLNPATEKGITGRPHDVPETSVADLRILQNLGSYLWPKNNTEFRVRLFVSLGLLVAAKVLNVQVPFLFKFAVDALSTSGGAATVAAPSNSIIAITLGTPMTVLVGYGIARAGAAACNELRNAVFAKVSQGTIRIVARKVFFHLHNLDLQFHLSRQTGALYRTIDRGTRGINFILTSMVFNIFPTFLEISMVAGILAYKFGAPFAWVTTATVAGYTAFTLAITQCSGEQSSGRQ